MTAADLPAAPRRRPQLALLLIPFLWQVGGVPFANGIDWRPFDLPFAMVWQMVGVLVATAVIALVRALDRRADRRVHQEPAGGRLHDGRADVAHPDRRPAQ